MKKLLIIALILLPLPLYLFGIIVLDAPRPFEGVATGNCNVIDATDEICSDSFRTEINVAGMVFAGMMLGSFLVGVGLLVQAVAQWIIRAARGHKS